MPFCKKPSPVPIRMRINTWGLGPVIGFSRRVVQRLRRVDTAHFVGVCKGRNYFAMYRCADDPVNQNSRRDM
jgi:hypothetical protein